ncbi:glycoside hydrolase [Myxozyma melibiosi]|uniref:Mannan endo-1,6-alpha-mannosidase n=1 Tax=Myxozyma melibiosi TaxID=54550 RepID=A0ABR1F0C4_9ASCO
MLSLPVLLATLLALLCRATAIEIDVGDEDSIKHAAFVFSHGMMSYYNGNQSGETPGMFVDPYYWWEAGAAWDTLLGYWYLTGDTTYNDQVKSSLLYQTGNDNNYVPSNQSTTEGNDDQAFWIFAALTACERNFSNPDGDDDPSWLTLAENGFNSMANRWDSANCGGGLRWQIFTWNDGYDYKNTISNAGLFLIAARLARYTSNDTYVEWAERAYNWTEDVGFLNTEYYFFYDGADISENCTDIDELQWSYNAAIFLAGAAFLYNYTEDELWYNRTWNILTGIGVFFDSNSSIMYEAACEVGGNCNTDQLSFKAYLARYLGLTASLVLDTYDTIMNHLTTTTTGVAQSCVGGTDNVTCGSTWLNKGWDDTWGLGQEMAALEVVQNLLIGSVDPPLTATTGGSSVVDNDTDSSSDDVITTADKAGAGVLTSFVLIVILMFGWWLIL